MMRTNDIQWQELLDAFHASPLAIALVAAGGGSGAISRCFQREGASRSFVEAVIPYSRASLAEYLGAPLAGASASSATARQLAAVARRRAKRLCDDHEGNRRPVGIALVAALPTEPPRRGGDRIHVASESIDGTSQWSLNLVKGSCTRPMAEIVSDEMMFMALARCAKMIDPDRFFHDAGLAIESNA
jgi:hypothetical protein